MDEKIFHADDLAIVAYREQNTLYTTLKRYCGLGYYRLFKGFYSLPPPNNLDPVLLGAAALHDYCYLSTEACFTGRIYIAKAGCYYLCKFKGKNFKILNYVYKSRK